MQSWIDTLSADILTGFGKSVHECMHDYLNIQCDLKKLKHIVCKKD